MKTVLFGNGSHAEIPMIKEAKRLGWHVISTGTDRNGLGHKLTDEYVYGDFSDKNFIYELAKEKKADAIVSACNDFSYIATAYACEKLGLKGHDSYETAKTIHHKDKFRKLTKQLGIKTPEVHECFNIDELSSILDNVSFPVMVKPVDLTGGKGVKICSDRNETIEAAKKAFDLSREDHIIVEEFISGSNHGSSFLIKNGKVIYGIFDDEQYGRNKYLVLGASSPSKTTDDSAKKQLIKDIEKIACHLKLVDGLFHAQYIIDKDNYPVIIDPCRRAPGDLYVLLAKYATGVDYPREIFACETGEQLNTDYVVEDNYIARECIMSERTGAIESINIDGSLKQFIIDKMIWANNGDQIEDIMKYKAGIIIMKFDDRETMDFVLDNYSSLVNITVKE